MTPAFNADLREQRVLGALLLADDPRRYISSLREEYFVNPVRQELFRAVRALSATGKPFNANTVFDAASAAEPRNRSAYHDELIACASVAPSLVMLPRWIDELSELAVRRGLEAVAQRLALSAGDVSRSPEEARQEAVAALRQLTSAQGGWVEIADLALGAVDRLEALSTGEETALSTGVPDLDSILAGLFPGELIVLGARPAVGKSAFAAFVGVHVAADGGKVGVCSLEMTPEQYLNRLISARSGVSGGKLRTGRGMGADDWSAVADACNSLAALQMPFTFSVRTVEALRREAERRKDEKGLDLLIVDYMQLLRTERAQETDYSRVTQVSHDLKLLALELKIPVLALAQVSRPQQKGAVRSPTLDSLRGSGDIEQDADAVIFLHRPEELDDPALPEDDRNLAETAARYGKQYIVTTVAKNRSGGVGRFGMIFDPEHMNYKGIERGNRR